MEPLTPEMVEEFLDWCWSEDPDFDDNPVFGRLRDVISDTGGAWLCDTVSQQLVQFARGKGLHASVFWIIVPHPLYVCDFDEPEEHCVTVIGGTCYDFTARQYNEELPVPYTWNILEYP